MFGASKLLDEKGIIVSDDLTELGKLICVTDATACFDEHTAKLKRIEIGIALRQAAALPKPDGRGRTLTEVIVDMDLCKTLNRAEKSFLKFARIAGSASLLQMAANPNISFSVLDEIAASKKPVESDKRREFVRRLKEQVEAACAASSGEEDQGPDSYRGSGPTRSDVIGMIRKAQIDFGVPTKASSGEKRGKELVALQQVSQLLAAMRILFLPDGRRDDWMAAHDISIKDLSVRIRAVQDDLVKSGVIEEDPNDILPVRIFGEKKSEPTEDDDEQEED